MHFWSNSRSILEQFWLHFWFNSGSLPCQVLMSFLFIFRVRFRSDSGSISDSILGPNWIWILVPFQFDSDCICLSVRMWFRTPFGMTVPIDSWFRFRVPFRPRSGFDMSFHSDSHSESIWDPIPITFGVPFGNPFDSISSIIGDSVPSSFWILFDVHSNVHLIIFGIGFQFHFVCHSDSPYQSYYVFHLVTHPHSDLTPDWLSVPLTFYSIHDFIPCPRCILIGIHFEIILDSI